MGALVFSVTELVGNGCHGAIASPLVVPADGGVDEQVSHFLLLALKVEVVVGCLDSQEGVVHDFLHLLLELGNNVAGKEGLVECFLLAIARYLRGLVVLLVHISTHVDSEDGSVGRFHQLTEFIGYGGDGEVVLIGLCDVLGHPHHPNDVVLRVPARGGVDEEKLPRLGANLQLTIGGLVPVERVHEDLLESSRLCA